ncbi:MAG: hypothetical protein M3O70_00530 [Actinomycetota bacterium]|nr:hypothetical protein [Actinomycetota bacterium]
MVVAAAPLAAAGIDASLLSEALPHVDAGRVPVRLAPGWLQAMWLGDVEAMACPWAVFVRKSALRREDASLAGLLVHELAHVEQWRHHGALGFLYRYLGDYLRHRLRGMHHMEAYRAIPFEQDAERLRRRLMGQGRT